MELALPLINDTLYDCPDAAANSSESWEEKVRTADSFIYKGDERSIAERWGLPVVAIIGKGEKKQAFESFIMPSPSKEL